jgi:argininosuccinate lyase
VEDVFDPLKSVERRNAIGGTSPGAVKEQIEICKATLMSPYFKQGEKS